MVVVVDCDALLLALSNFTECPFWSCLLVACNIFLQHKFGRVKKKAHKLLSYREMQQKKKKQK